MIRQIFCRDYCLGAKKNNSLFSYHVLFHVKSTQFIFFRLLCVLFQIKMRAPKIDNFIDKILFFYKMLLQFFFLQSSSSDVFCSDRKVS